MGDGVGEGALLEGGGEVEGDCSGGSVGWVQLATSESRQARAAARASRRRGRVRPLGLCELSADASDHEFGPAMDVTIASELTVRPDTSLKLWITCRLVADLLTTRRVSS